VDSGPIAAVASLPGILSFTKLSSGQVYYVGLLAGSSIHSGTVAIEGGHVGGLANVSGLPP